MRCRPRWDARPAVQFDSRTVRPGQLWIVSGDTVSTDIARLGHPPVAGAAVAAPAELPRWAGWLDAMAANSIAEVTADCRRACPASNMAPQ